MQKERLRIQSRTRQEQSPRWRAEFFAPVFQEATQTLPEVMGIHLQNRRTRILATMVPDELVYTINATKKEKRTFLGIVLLANVSGMTMLHDNYKYAGHGGSIGMNTILDAYFGYMVQAVYSYGGDVFRITENGLLAIWNVRSDELIFTTLHEVITCGLRIQESIGRFVTTVNVTLKLKVAISAGSLTFVVIGENNCYNYLMAGSPMEEAKLAKNACLPGDLVLAGSAWGHCNPSCYEYVIKDTYNVKIQRIITTFRQTARGKVVLEEKARKKMFTVEERISLYWQRIDPHDDLIVASRPAINEAVLRQLGKVLKTFIIHSAVRLIDEEKPLEYLTEARKVTSMFINVIPTKSSMPDLIRLVDDIFILLSSSIMDIGGDVVRVRLFQKDITFLSIFGLQDGANEFNSKNALLSGLKIRHSIKNFYGVQKVSVGITTASLGCPTSFFTSCRMIGNPTYRDVSRETVFTNNANIAFPEGMVHCGIVGHFLRRGYVVVGAPLQKAMELGATCVEKVTCDLNTLLRSDLPWNRFILQDYKILKGVGASSIYEYIDDPSNDTENDVELSMGYPILGRSAELNIMSLTLDDIGLESRDYTGILVKGETGTGKSRLLDGFVTLIRDREIQTITVTLTPDYSIAPHSVIYPILSEIFDIDEYCSIGVREQKMVERLSDVVSPQDFCYLNEIMRVRFPISKRCSLETELERQTQAMKILKGIFLMSKARRCILIDDIQHMDQMSWQMLSLILDVKYMLLIATIEIPLDDPTPKSVSQIYLDKRMAHMTLGPISTQCITALACQILNVQAIPQFLERELFLRTKNNPGLCQALLTAALCHDGLQRVEMTPKKATEYGLMFSPVHMVSKIPLYTCPEDVAPALPWERRLKIHACLISDYQQLQYSCQIFQINDMMLNTYTTLSTYEQELLKCAALLGIILTRHMLQIMMPNFSNFHTTKAITNMFNLRILCCASLIISGIIHTETLNFCTARKRNTFSDSRHLLYCHCSDPQISDTFSRRTSGGTATDELPWYSRCKFLAFKMPRFQQFIYDLIPDDEKIQFHLKAVDLYKVEAHKCKACGGGSFLDIPTRHKTNKRTLLAKPFNTGPPVSQKSVDYAMIKESFDPATVRISSQNKSSQPFLDDKPISVATVSHYHAQGEQPETRTDSTGSDGRRRVSILPFYAEEYDQTIGASSESSLEANGDLKDRQTIDGSGKCCDWMKNRFLNKSMVEPKPESNFKSGRIPRMVQFRGVDFRNCQCSLVLNNLYKRLLYHSKNTGNTGNHIQYLIDYSAGLIRIAEYLHAIKILTRADELNQVYESFKNDPEKSIINRMITKGIILSLLGETYFQLGYYENARRYTLDEMAIYGYMLSTKKLLVCHQIIANERRQLVHQWFPGLSMVRLSRKDALEKSRISACISRLSSIFMTNDQPKLAKLTVLVSLNISAKCTDQPITKLCSYRLAMLYYRQIGEMGICQRLEKSALRIIADQFAWNDLNGVLVVADVYESIFYSKLIRGELRNAIEYGFKALQIAGKFHIVKFRLQILPILIQAAVQAKRISEAVDLLRELSYLAREDVDMSATIWYYALCLDLLLDAGVCIESVETCQEFAKKLLDANGKNVGAIIRDPDCSKRLVTNVWLLLTRMGKDSVKYELPREVYVAGMRHDNYSNLWTILKAVECRMLKITYFLNYKKGNTLPDIRGDVTELLSHLTRASKTSGFLKPRLYLLEAYMCVIRGHINKAKAAVDSAQKYARRQESSLMQTSIELHKRAWLHNYSTVNLRWTEVASEEKIAKWHDVHNLSTDDYMTALYCLPKPENCL